MNVGTQDYIVPPCEEQVEILVAEESFLLVNKPRPLLSVPGKHPLNKDCLITRLKENYPEARIVHRLDMNTSGIMVVALSKASHRNLSIQFEKRNIYKEYIAVLYGRVEKDQGSIELPLICDWPNRPKQMVDHELGKSALLGHPILGCRLYAHEKALAMSERLMLHASKLEFDHPESGERVKQECAVPF